MIINMARRPWRRFPQILLITLVLAQVCPGQGAVAVSALMATSNVAAGVPNAATSLFSGHCLPVAAGPVTIRTRLQFADLDNVPDGQGMWLAGLADNPGGPPNMLALSFAQVERGWFGPFWELQLQSAAALIPSQLKPQAGAGFLQGSQTLTLPLFIPEPEHVYEAVLGYNQLNGAAKVSLRDITAGKDILSANYQLLPTATPLFAGAGIGIGEDSAVTTGPATGPAGSAAMTVLDLQTSPDLVPAAADWWIGQRGENDQFYHQAQRIDRRLASVLHFSLPWADQPGELLYVIADAGGTPLFTGRTAADIDTPLPLADLTAGDYQIVLEYRQGARLWEVDRRQFSIGLVNAAIENVRAEATGAGPAVIKGNLRVTSDGRIGTTTLGIEGALLQREFQWNTASQQGTLRQEKLGEPAVLTSFTVEIAGEGELILPFAFPAPDKASETPNVTWQVNLQPWMEREALLAQVTTSVAWFTPAVVREKPWEGYLRQESSQRIALAPGVDVYHLQGYIPAGPLDLFLLVADLTTPGLRVDTLVGADLATAGALWPRSVVGRMTETSGALAGINASFFHIQDTMDPTGLLMQGGRLLKSGLPGYHAMIGVAGDKAYVGAWSWRGGVRRSDGTAYQAVASFNVPNPGGDQIVLFAAPWLHSPGADNARGEVVELVVTDLHHLDNLDNTAQNGWPAGGLPRQPQLQRGRVQEVRHQQPGVQLKPGMVVITGAGAGARYLRETYAAGDEIDLVQAVEGVTAWPGLEDWRQLEAITTGNQVLVFNGDYGSSTILTDSSRHPRTAVGVSFDQHILYWLVVDGRSPSSVGMTYRELADFFLNCGAFNAVNLDGGGSSTLAIREASGRVRVLNTPSDGAQRYVPDGLGIFYREGSGDSWSK